MSVMAVRAEDSSKDQDGFHSPSPLLDYFEDWFERVSRIQAEQPGWLSPLATTTPRLNERLRYDQSWQTLPDGHSLHNFGSNKGLEFIPAERISVIVGLPAWQTENTTPLKEGWADETFLFKYRILSANEQHGDYILTAFMGLSIPSGSASYTSGHYSFTPALAGGKGWGRFDFQSTLGISVPDNGAERSGAGTPISFNTTYQYHLWTWFWPEVELNYTYYPNGKHDGLNQLFLTPGLLLGRFPLWRRIHADLGIGCQIAVTDAPLVRRNWILSFRIPF